MPPPTITGLSVNEGPQAGGNALVVTGTNLGTATSLRFLDAGTTSLSFSIDSPTQLTVASMPAHSKAIGFILVVNPSGNGESTDTYAYDDSATDPRVTGLTPSDGSTAGGTSVAIHGERFTGASAVDFGFSPALSFSVDSDSQITAVSPSTGFAHGVYVKVTNGGEVNPNGVPNVFAYVAPSPTISSITPSSAFSGGGTLVHIIGTNLGGTYEVDVDGVSVGFSQIDDEHVDFTTAPHIAATGVEVDLFCDGGGASSSIDFTDTPDATAECIILTVGAFVADGITPDGNGIVYTVESIDGWWDTPPMRSATAEVQPDGEFVTVNRVNARQIVVTILAHAPGGDTPLGDVGCFTAMQTVKAAFDSVYVPVLMEVADPSGADVSTLVRNAAPTRASVVGQVVAARIQVTLIAPDPTLA